VFKNHLFAIFLVLMCSAPSRAQSFVGEGFNTAIEAVQDGIDLIWPDSLNLEGASVRLGLGFGVTPDYMGSDNYRFRVVPLVDIRYKDIWQLNGSRLTYSLVRKEKWSAGPLINMRFGRNASQSVVLEGFGDISDTLEIGGFVRYQSESAMVSAEYRHGISAGIGSSILLTAGHGIYKNGRFSAMLAARARWMDSKSMQTNFGLTDAQSEASSAGLSAFSANASVAELNGNLVGSFELNDQVRLLSLISYGKLMGDAADSPLVNSRHGSSTQIITGVGLAIAF